MKTKERQLNIELLRIIAMVIVLVGHYNIACNGDVTYELVHTNLLKAIGIAEIKSWTFVCVPSFIVISGYFGIHWKWKGLFNYLFQISFWGGIVYVITWLFGLHSFSILPFIKNMTCFLHGVNWFFAAYLGLYMMSPILNAFIEKADERQMMLMTLAFFTFQAIFGWILKLNEFYYGLTMTSLLGWYLLGGMLRKSSLNIFQLKAWQNMAIFLGIGLFCVFLNCAIAYVGFKKDVFSNISPLQVIQTTYLFLFCRSLKITRGKAIITFFASSAFAGLLMHSWEGAHMYGMGHDWIYAHLSVPFVFSMTYICLFFIVACCLDKIRIWCWNRISEKLFA